jgi:elongation factor Ts
MHVVAARPEYVSREDVPSDVVEREMGIFREQAMSSGKPEHVLDKIIEGKLEKWYGEICFLEQGFIRDPDKTIQELLTDNIAALGENIRINAFARLAIGD